MPASFKTRLTLWNVVTLALAMTALGGLMAFASQRFVLQSIDRELEVRASPIVQEFRGRPGPNPNGQNPVGDPMPGGPSNPAGPQGARRGLFERFRQPPIPEGLDQGSKDLILLRRPRIVNPNGESILDPTIREPWDRGAAIKAQSGIPVFSYASFNGSPVRILSAPLKAGGQTVGVVQVAAELAPLHALQSSQLLVFGVLAPATLLLAALGASFLTCRALKPVEDLTAAARKISARDLGQRIPTEGDDEFNQLAEEFNGMVARLQTSFAEKEQLLNAQKQFTADASHELRTPLTRIKIVTSAAEEDPSVDPESQERFRTIQTATDHMAALVDQMLTLARTENLKESSRLESVSLTSVLAHAVQIAGLDRDPRLKLELKDKRVLADAPLLERAVVNLLTNAARHTPKSGRIILASEESEGLITVSVADTGEGIAPEHLDKVTQRFYRVDSARNQATGGTGLGLSIVESIAAAHGGKLTLHSEPGQGTKATLTLRKA